jgi:uncharacterized protein (DUF1800 family)
LAQASRAGLPAWLDAQLRGGSDADLPPDVQRRLAGFRISTEPMDAAVFRLDAQRRRADAIRDDEEKKAAHHEYQEALNVLGREAIRRQFLRHLHSPCQLQEKMTWFWTNHFSVHLYKGMIRAGVADYEDRIRVHSLGRFRDLLGVVVRHPVMLTYLDNAQNAVRHVNENFARELLELHTLGVDGGYTQADVQELARVLTGFGVNPRDPAEEDPPSRAKAHDGVLRSGVFEFNPKRHDGGDKRVLGTLIRGRGAEELDEVLDRLASHPATARHVCRRLAQYFVADEPPPDLVERLAGVFLERDGSVRDVLGVLFASPGFASSLGARFKDPMQFVLSSLRLCYEDRVIPNTEPLIHWTNRLGESPYLRSTPDGYALSGSAWQGAAQMTLRFDIAKTVANSSAGLFKSADAAAPEPAAFPQAARAYFYEAVQSRLSTPTQRALEQASSPQEWNMLVLSSPEFMMC